MPALSIIVPVYNVEGYLDECLESLQSQTFKDFEIICVNDGSTDASGAILAEWGQRDSRIRIVTKENGGLSSARNAGLSKAQGEYVAFLDSDDRFTPNACETIVRALRDTDADVLTFGGTCFPAELEYPWIVLQLSPRDVVYDGFHPDLLFREMSTPFAWRCACRRAFLVDQGICFDESLPFGEDQVFLASIYPRSRRTALISDRLYEYRLSRTGSLMSSVAGSAAEKARKHLAIAQRVLGDWHALGLLENMRSDALAWFHDFALSGIIALPDGEAATLFFQASQLAQRYWEPEALGKAALQRPTAKALEECLGADKPDLAAIRAAQTYSRPERLTLQEPNPKPSEKALFHVVGTCRGDGKTYVKIKTDKPWPADSLSARAWCINAEFPSGIYPLEETGGSRLWVLEVPAADYLGICVGVAHEGESLGALTLNYERAKWESRLNYRLRRSLCSEIRDIDRRFTQCHYQLRIMRFLEAENDVIVWRIRIDWQGAPDERPILQALDSRGIHFSPRQHFFEFQQAPTSEECNRLFVSVEIPANLHHFTLTAHSPRPDTNMKPGFTSINPAAYEGFKYASWKRMKDARADDAAYGAWLENHRAKATDLAAQSEHSFAKGPLFSIVVPCYNSDEGFFRAMVESVSRQSYRRWELILVDASPDSPVVRAVGEEQNDPRIRIVPLETNRGIVGNTNAGIAAAQGDYLAFLDHDDLLEPDALFHYAKALEENSAIDVLFCDEDLFEEEGSFKAPTFKTQLNIDLLYSHNCVTHFLAMRTRLIEEMGTSPEDVSGAQDYDLTLRALATNANFHHVPRILYHWRIHEGSTSQDGEGGKPYAEEAGRLALQRHFEQRGIAGAVETTPHPYVYRMRYALPSPLPLVSIVIPSKDHIDMLGACVASLLDYATYPNFEIVIVENNSTAPETFAYYESIQKHDARVRIARWADEFNYSKIINFGAQQARGDYLLFLNNDTELITPDFIEEMLGYLQRPEVGIVGAKLYFRDRLTQHAGMLVGPHGAVAHVNQDFPRNREGYRGRAVRPNDFSAVTGACQLVSREVFEEVGGYDPAFAVGFNDADFCLRVGRKGRLVVFTPYAELYHYEFASRGREEADPAKQERWERERALFAERWADVFENGDPYTNPNFDRDSAYYALGS